MLFWRISFDDVCIQGGAPFFWARSGSNKLYIHCGSQSLFLWCESYPKKDIGKCTYYCRNIDIRKRSVNKSCQET